MKKKIVITAGGTGGHIFPALALAKQLTQEFPNIELLFVGGGLSKNRYFDREKGVFPHENVSCGFLTKNPFHLAYNVGLIFQGMWQSRRIIKNFEPNVVVGFGSFYTFPTLAAAKLCSIPIILHEANSVPGKVNALLSKYATVTGVHFPETIDLLKGKSVEVGMPLREGYLLGSVSVKEAKQYFELDENKTVILVFGGSQGARKINQLFAEALEGFSQSGLEIQVLHFTGNESMTIELREAYRRLGIQACVKDFEPRMDLAWQAADMMISRAGASTIAEAMEFEVPGILIPYPGAANHQEKNADFMVNTVGGAVKLLEKGATKESFLALLKKLLDPGQRQLKVMQASIQSYKRQKRNQGLCSLVMEMLSHFS